MELRHRVPVLNEKGRSGSDGQPNLCRYGNGSAGRNVLRVKRSDGTSVDFDVLYKVVFVQLLNPFLCKLALSHTFSSLLQES